MSPEHVLGVARQPIIWSLVALGVVAPTLLHQSTAVALIVASRDAEVGAPRYVHAGVPFIVHDGYATQLCISSRSGRPLPPFVAPAAAQGSGDGPQRVYAGVPFTVHDASSTALCVSTRGGQTLVPFVIP